MTAFLAHMTVLELPVLTGWSVLFFLAGTVVGLLVATVTGPDRDRS